MGALEDRLLQVLRVPPNPRVPTGETDGVRVFRAAPNYFRYQLAKWSIAQVSALIGLFAGLFIIRLFVPDPAPTWMRWVYLVEIGAWLTFLGQLPVTFTMLRLDFTQRWYIVTGRSLRIREGITSVREQTMTFANVQNMSIRQGPLQRLLGIADLEVHTAGGGARGPAEGGPGASAGTHVGRFRGVSDAAAIRDLIRERVRLFRDAGLGDPEDPDSDTDRSATPQGVVPPVLAAAREVLAEVRAIRS